MAKVKCEYCNGYVLDTDEKCPNCGAPNKNHTRAAHDTPKTIEELKDWYKARNLPPENVTRFFIGKNITEPKAFGIYEENGIFIVYKNKADGTRAVRYSGTDEAYAVNELYLRLKEEILNQKSNNARRNNTSSNYSYNNSYNNSTNRNTSFLSRLFTKRIKRYLILFLFLFLLSRVALPAILLFGVFDSNYALSNNYYVPEDDSFYYYAGYNYSLQNNSGYEWWHYNEGKNDWELFATKKSVSDFPDGINKKTSHYSSYEFKKAFGEQYLIENSLAYIDQHHEEPSNAYYECNGKAYYYMRDPYAKSYGYNDDSGWYVYNDNSWEYYCSFYDKDTLGDDLWYHEDDYYVASNYDSYVSGSIYYFNGSESNNWTVPNFEDTEWYEDTLAAEAAYQKDLDDKRNSSSSSSSDWSSDSSYDWSSSDSWDSGSSDWDSDW